MSNHDKPGSLDGAIDAAVREMMQVDARPGLRYRVARAISAPPPRRQGFRLGLAAIGLTLVALMSVFVIRPAKPATPVHAPQVAEAPVAPAIPLAGPQAVEAGAVALAPVASPSQSRRRTMPTPDSIFGPRSDRVAAASVPSAPTAPVHPDAFSEPAESREGRFGIMPIMLEPIRVTPLSIQPLFADTMPSRR